MELSPDPDELARALAAIEHRGQVRLAQSENAADVAINRLWDLGSVARIALREAGRLAAVEAEIAATVPGVADRLRLLGDVAAVCLAAVVADATRALLTDPWGEGDQ